MQNENLQTLLQEIEAKKQEILDLAPDLASDEIFTADTTEYQAREKLNLLNQELEKAHFANLLNQVFTLSTGVYDNYFIADNIEIINWLWHYVQNYSLWLPIKTVGKLFIKFRKNI